MFGVYQRGVGLVPATWRKSMKWARESFMRECGVDDWGILEALGFRVYIVGSMRAARYSQKRPTISQTEEGLGWAGLPPPSLRSEAIATAKQLA